MALSLLVYNLTCCVVLFSVKCVSGESIFLARHVSYPVELGTRL